MKLCKKCGHAKQPSKEVDLWLCLHPAVGLHRIDPVTGEKAVADECRHQRRFGDCGIEAKNWEPAFG